MKTLQLTSIFVLSMLLVTSLAAEETEPLAACDAACDICMEKCDAIDDNSEKCYDLCDRVNERCIVLIKAQK